MTFIPGLSLNSSGHGDIARLEKLGQHQDPVALPRQVSRASAASFDDKAGASAGGIDAAEHAAGIGRFGRGTLAWVGATAGPTSHQHHAD